MNHRSHVEGALIAALKLTLDPDSGCACGCFAQYDVGPGCTPQCEQIRAALTLAASTPQDDDARALALAESERNAARAERDALSDVLREIHAELDGTEWESATCQSIADRLREIGYTVRDLESEDTRPDRACDLGCSRRFNALSACDCSRSKDGTAQAHDAQIGGAS